MVGSGIHSSEVFEIRALLIAALAGSATRRRLPTAQWLAAGPGGKKVTPNRIAAAAFLMVLSCTATTYSVVAQDTGSPQSASSLKEWKASDEITFGGAIREVVSKNSAGTPAGLKLLMDGSQGVLYVSVGPNLDDQIKQALAPGQVIQVVGIVETFKGQSYLLARELVIGNQKIEVRNKQGFLVHSSASAGSRTTRTDSSGLGGAR